MPARASRRTRPQRRMLVFLTTLATTIAITLGLGLSAHPAQAVSDCSSMPAGWTLVAANPAYGASAQVWKYPGGWLVARIANTAANGKVNVSAEGGRTQNSHDLGWTNYIGTAPNGAWCSDPVQATLIWSAVAYDAGGAHYWRALWCATSGCQFYSS